MIQDTFYTVVYWVEENLGMVIAGILLVAAVVLFYFLNSIGQEDEETMINGVAEGTIEEVEELQEETEIIDELFSQLGERNIGSIDEFPAYEIDLYLKKPFVHENDLKEVIKNYVEIYKWKEDFNLSGLKLNIYDRKIVHDKGLKPRAVAYYFKEIDSEKLLTEEEGGERLFGDNVLGENLTDSIEEGEEPDYQEYELRIDNYKPLDLDKGITPLTDQEFEFYLKMDMYKEILGGSKYGGSKLYLQWDLGKDVYKDGIVAIEREFDTFEKRHLELGGQTEYYENEFILKQELALEKPQFLLFALTNQVVTDPLEAQKDLIKDDADLFKNVIEEDIERKVEEEIIGEDEEIEEEKGEGSESDNEPDSEEQQEEKEEEEYQDFGGG